MSRWENEKHLSESTWIEQDEKDIYASWEQKSHRNILEIVKTLNTLTVMFR